MKKLILALLVLLVVSNSISGQVIEPAAPLSKADYLKKSRNQKTTGFVLLGIGAACIGIAAPGDVSFDVLPVLVIGGGACIVGSIPFFIASGKNKRRANSFSASIRMESQPIINGTLIHRIGFPAVSIKVGL